MVALALLLAACGDDGTGRLQPRPGDSLLDHLDRAVVRGLPASTAPADWAARVAPGDTAAVILEPDDWTAAEPVGEAARRLWGLRDDTRSWQPVGGPLDLDAAEIYAVRVGGVELTELPERALASLPEGLRAWQDPDTEHFVWWSDTGMRYLTTGPPGQLRAHTARDAHALLAGADLPAGRRTSRLLTTHEFAEVTRPALRLPAPASLAFELGALACDTLRLSLGVHDRGLDLAGDVLRLSPEAGDGVTFTVDVEHDGQSVTVLKRHVGPGQGWIDLEADLTPWLGRNVRLVLRSGPGPDGDATFDEALWADLTLLGPIAAPPARPSLLLIDIDTLRADRLSVYGHTRDTSPGLAAWIERWGPRTVVFDDCTATSSWTLPSTMSLITGLAVRQHGVDHSSKSLPADVPTLAELLAAAGYETHAIVEQGFVDPAFGFARGFDRFENRTPHQPDWSGFLRQLTDRRSERPFFALLHTYMVHAPYPDDDAFADADAPYDGPLAGLPLAPKALENDAARGGRPLDDADRDHIDRLYDAGVRRMDAFLSAFLEELDSTWPASSLLVVITSDHGEELWDHGGVDHGHSLHAELLRVPLIVRFPAALTGRPRRSDRPVSLLDVAPTMLEAAGLEAPPPLPGESLPARLGPGGDAPRPRVGELAARLTSIQQGGHKLILPGPGRPHGQPELYDLRRDPGETDNRAGLDAARVEALRDLLEQFQARHPEAGAAGAAAPDADTRAVLEQLGYAGDDH